MPDTNAIHKIHVQRQARATNAFEANDKISAAARDVGL